MNEQKHLQYIVKLTFDNLCIPEILAVKALWKGDLVELVIGCSAELSEDQKEIVDIGLTEIMAQFSHGQLKEQYVVKTEPFDKDYIILNNV